MENASTDKLAKIFMAWIVGMICLPGISFLGGALILNFTSIEWLKGIAVVFFFIGMYGLLPSIAFTGIMAVICGLLAPTVKKAVVSSALINLGIFLFLALLFGGVF